MKKPGFLLISLVFILPAIGFFSCANGNTARDTELTARDAGAAAASAEFADHIGKEWELVEFQTGGRTVYIDRGRLRAEGLRDAFTISFQDGRVSGAGAPNRFFGPYTAGDNQSLSIGTLASTMMASIFEPAELREHDYFSYLSRVTRWEIRQGRLELHSTGADGGPLVLIFQ